MCVSSIRRYYFIYDRDLTIKVILNTMEEFYKYPFKTYSKKKQGNVKALKYCLLDIIQEGHYCWKSDVSKEDGIRN